MCDWKPGPRCFTHYMPQYFGSVLAYLGVCEAARKEAEENGGKLSEETRAKLEQAFVEYQRKGMLFYTSPKAREEFLESHLEGARKEMECTQTRAAQDPDNEALKILASNAEQSYEMLQRQGIEGAHRWEQAKIATRLHDLRSERGRNLGLWSESRLTPEDLEGVDIATWDKACPEGQPVLVGMDQPMQRSKSHGIFREKAVHVLHEVELPTGEKVVWAEKARIIQKTKSSSYTVEYSIQELGEHSGILTPNTGAVDSAYNIGAVVESRPMIRGYHKHGLVSDPSFASSLVRARKSQDLEEEQFRLIDLDRNRFEENRAMVQRDINERGLYRRAHLKHGLNEKEESTGRTQLTQQILDSQGGNRVTFNSVRGAEDAIRKNLGSYRQEIAHDFVLQASHKGAVRYFSEQYGVYGMKKREDVESRVNKDIEKNPEAYRRVLRTRNDRRREGGSHTRAEREALNFERRAEQIRKKLPKESTQSGSVTSHRNLVKGGVKEAIVMPITLKPGGGPSPTTVYMDTDGNLAKGCTAKKFGFVKGGVKRWEYRIKNAEGQFIAKVKTREWESLIEKARQGARKAK